MFIFFSRVLIIHIKIIVFKCLFHLIIVFIFIISVFFFLLFSFVIEPIYKPRLKFFVVLVEGLFSRAFLLSHLHFVCMFIPMHFGLFCRLTTKAKRT